MRYWYEEFQENIRIINLLQYYREGCDRLTFDELFKLLLAYGYNHESAKDLIVLHCCPAPFVMQERVYNKFYLTISANDTVSGDLLGLLEIKRHINEYNDTYLN